MSYENYAEKLRIRRDLIMVSTIASVVAIMLTVVWAAPILGDRVAVAIAAVGFVVIFFSAVIASITKLRCPFCAYMVTLKPLGGLQFQWSSPSISDQYPYCHRDLTQVEVDGAGRVVGGWPGG